jgi:hypothetical protein
MSVLPEAPDSFPIAHYRADAHLGVESLERAHGRAFLLLSSDSDLDVPTRPGKTLTPELREGGRGWLATKYLVFPVRKSERSVIQRFISVGRTKTNDVVIPDVSLSKFHAYFEEVGGKFQLQDARSRNGTFIDEKRVPAQGEGPPKVVRIGAHVRFGGVELMFFDAATLVRMIVDLGA